MPSGLTFESETPLHREQIESFEMMFRSGIAIAAAAALHYCHKHSLRVPPWLLAAASELLCDLLSREKAKRRGRSCGHVARHRQDRIDYVRWDQVKVIRDKQKDLKEEVQSLRSQANIPRHIMDDRENTLEWAGNTLNRAFECAAMLLEGSDAYGGAEAIKRSYFTVERNSKNPSQRLRYHLLDARFLDKVGISDGMGPRPRRKIVPLYELTL